MTSSTKYLQIRSPSHKNIHEKRNNQNINSLFLVNCQPLVYKQKINNNHKPHAIYSVLKIFSRAIENGALLN